MPFVMLIEFLIPGILAVLALLGLLGALLDWGGISACGEILKKIPVDDKSGGCAALLKAMSVGNGVWYFVVFLSVAYTVGILVNSLMYFIVQLGINNRIGEKIIQNYGLGNNNYQICRQELGLPKDVEIEKPQVCCISLNLFHRGLQRFLSRLNRPCGCEPGKAEEAEGREHTYQGQHKPQPKPLEPLDLFYAMRDKVYQGNVPEFAAEYKFYDSLQRLSRGVIPPLIGFVLLFGYYLWKSEEIWMHLFWGGVALITAVGIVLSYLLWWHSIEYQEESIVRHFLTMQKNPTRYTLTVQ